jgi:hypothetical protein
MELDQEAATQPATDPQVGKQPVEPAEAPAAQPDPVISAAAMKIPTANIKASKRFAKYNRDLMTALLKDPSYTVEEAEKILNNFMGVK